MKKLLLSAVAAILFSFGTIVYAATLSVQSISYGGTQVTYANADTGSGDVVSNIGQDVLVLLTNPGASSADVTITAQDTSFVVPGYGPVEQTDKVISLAAGETWMGGPFPASVWNNSSNQLELTYAGTGATDVDVAILRSNSLKPQF